MFIDSKFNTDNWVEAILIAVIISSALYYYYLNIATERKSENGNVTYNQQIISWWITAVQYIGFLSMWFLLRKGWSWYAGGILFLNITYVVWDVFHWAFVWGKKSTREGRMMFYWDIGGTVCTIILLVCTFTLPDKDINNSVDAHHAMLIFGSGAFVVFQALSGLGMAILLFKYNPLRYLSMDGRPIQRATNEKQL